MLWRRRKPADEERKALGGGLAWWLFVAGRSSLFLHYCNLL